ncbi:unnamed protein product [Triticum turgidum subsp. durum]|uniref:Exocyst component Exo84 C-terminal domain-containing protein n=1 Tax=Triticum turgidum subsp. durum TaxID=4567 RepID=A0A9R1NPR7_TRITD|nr:unnamed protein product [Triticum turgidum subsp. durum]
MGRPAMESSSEEELEDDFPGHEWITPQSSIRAAYQSQTEKSICAVLWHSLFDWAPLQHNYKYNGIRKTCSELLELKDAIENLCGNMQSKYHAFLRISEEVVEAEQELIELQKHVSAQGMLVQDLMSGVCRELDMWQKYSKEEHVVEKDFQSELNEILSVDTQDPKVIFLDEIDILLAEHKLEKALLALDTEEKKYMTTDGSGKESDAEISAYKTALFKRKSILEDQLVRYSEQPSLSITELRKSLSGLIKIGKGSVAHQVLLKTYGSRLHRDVEAFLPTCSVYTETYSATLSQLVFSAISKVLKESSTLFGDSPTNMNRIIQWAEYEIEAFARLVKENSPLPESVSALRSVCICIQTTLAHCSCLEAHGLKFSKLLMLLLRPHIEEVLELNFRRVRRKIIDSARNDDILRLGPQEGSPTSDSVAPKMMLTSSGKKFMSVINYLSSPVCNFYIYYIQSIPSVVNNLHHTSSLKSDYSQLVTSMSPHDLSSFLNRPSFLEQEEGRIRHTLALESGTMLLVRSQNGQCASGNQAVSQGGSSSNSGQGRNNSGGSRRHHADICMCFLQDLLDHVTPMTTVHFGGTILSNFLQLFDRYVETLIKVLPGPSEDDNVVESQEPVELKAESDAQQLALIGTAYTVADELLPAAVSKFFDMQTKKKETSGTSEGLGPGSVYSTEYKEWKRHLQHSLDKLRDHFCRQYVLSFIYLEGKSRLDARMYLEGNRDDLFWDSDPLPSLPFQALFGRLQQLASVAGDVLLGKEKIQKVLLSRLTETVVMWLSNEQEFWDVFENESIQLQPSGLQQLILDMHFLVEIAVCGRYPHRPVQQLVSVIITRAIAAFSAREVDPQSALPEDEWFLDTAKTAINKLMLGTSGSESDLEAPIAPHDDGISEDSDSISCLSSMGSEDSFASANNDDLENPVYFTDPDS